MISIDLGSNTCRFLAFDEVTQQVIWTFERAVKTADGLHISGMISDAAVERIVAAINEAKGSFAFEGHAVDAVTTEAMRQARNAPAVIETLERRSGIRFRIIGAEEEAAYTLAGVEYRLGVMGIASRRYALIDIGGGSTEVIVRSGDTTLSRSFPIGIVTLSQRSDSPETLQALIAEAVVPVAAYAASCYERIGTPEMLIATAGTPTTVAAYLLGMEYATYDAARVNGYVLTCKGIAEALEALLALPECERTRYVGVGREELIITGIGIISALYRTLGFSQALVVDDGLREGVALCYGKNLLKALTN
ncbi:MAG: phosphatase [Campylobacterales bacterium]|nr:phosphatase [Campylobacterales bacterium]